MFYTIRGLLEDRGVALSQTAYADCADEMLDFRIESGDFYEIPDLREGMLRYKNTANVCGFAHLADALPGLERVDLRRREIYPFFAANLDLVAQALSTSPEGVGIEGGPCLFGEHEVTSVVTLASGDAYHFDYSCGRRYTDASARAYSEDLDEDEADLASFICAHADEVADIGFESYKTGLTRQEYLHCILPFAFAAALDVPLVVSLPDLSYRKYLAYAARALPQELAERTMAAFDEMLYAISDLFLDLYDRLREHYQPRRLAVFHGRDPELVQVFEEARRPFIERKKVLRSLTARPAMLEPIKDYISLPALPLYLFGSRTILEVNSTIEADSYRKCRMAHRSAADFGCILFPEMLSADGEHTFYYAQVPDKEYGDYTYVVGWNQP